MTVRLVATGDAAVPRKPGSIQTGGGEIGLRANTGEGYGYLLVNGPSPDRNHIQLQLTHEAALDLRFQLGQMLSTGRL